MGIWGGDEKYFFSNTHFDTTRANIEFSGAKAIDLPVQEAKNFSSDYPFKGNIDVEKLSKWINDVGAENVAAVILTVTNNSGGGQPVSMANAIATSKLCKSHNIVFVLDACRIAENSFFVQKNEVEYKNHSYFSIAQEMCTLADACIMSAKKRCTR